jgi:hypothetical protein
MNARRRTQVVTALLSMIALPMLAQAEAPDPKMDACIQAFVESNIGKDRQVTVRKIFSYDTALDANAREQKIFLKARTTGSGKLVAHGTCVVTGNEIVLTTNGKAAQTTKIAQAPAAQSSR